MALISISENTGDGNGNFMSYVKYDSKAGRAFRADKKDGVTTHVDITNTFKALFDFESVEIGYLRFPAAAAPETVLVPYGQQMPPRPAGEKWKMGIRMHIKLSPTIGGAVDPLDAHLVKGDGTSTYRLKVGDKGPGRLAWELWASHVLLLVKEPTFGWGEWGEWSRMPIKDGSRKLNYNKMMELRHKHPDLAEAIDAALAAKEG